MDKERTGERKMREKGRNREGKRRKERNGEWKK
jgi:hypothetical protein